MLFNGVQLPDLFCQTGRPHSGTMTVMGPKEMASCISERNRKK